ncbi:MAG: single-stranded DNA-binding protein [Actinomycetaceae bacterium]|nr:single-stranded DNA-binding protein [Actinomycetaceae bacterium]
MSEASFDEDVVKKLNKEGDLAADYLEELLDIADLDGDIEISMESDRASLGIVTENGLDRRLQKLIGKNGEVLESLQELTRLAVQSKTGERSRLMLDIAGYRAELRESITERTYDAINFLRENKKPVVLKPMNPFERKVVHDVAAREGVYSHSEGADDDRHVVLHLEESYSTQNADSE